VGSQISERLTFLGHSASSLSQIGAHGNFVVFSTALVLTVQLWTEINHLKEYSFCESSTTMCGQCCTRRELLLRLDERHNDHTYSTPKILLIESNPAAADKIRAALAAAGSGSFEVEWVRELSEGLARLTKKGIDAVLLELSLPDSHGIETFDNLFSAAPDIPILVLGNGNEALAKEAVGRGAQDYLLAGHLDSYSLPRALRNAIERKAVEDALYVEKERAVVTLNSIGDAVLCTDVSGNITYLNLVAETMTGWRREEAIGKRLAEVFRIIDGPTRNPARDPMEMAVEQNRTVGLTVNCVLIRRDGFESAIEDSAAPIHDRAGRITGAVIVFHDVSAAAGHVGSNDALRAARCCHESAQSPVAQRPNHSVNCLGSPLEQAGCRDLSGFGSFQIHQRFSGTCHRRQTPSVRVKTIAGRRARFRHGQPPGRR